MALVVTFFAENARASIRTIYPISRVTAFVGHIHDFVKAEAGWVRHTHWRLSFVLAVKTDVFLMVRHPRCFGSITKNFVYYTYSQTQL